MNVFVAGATGAVGRPLIAQLLDAGHVVSAISRSESRAASLRARGVDAVVGDALDATGMRATLARLRPEVVVNQLTTFPNTLNPWRAMRDLMRTNRLRSQGSRVLDDAARAAGVRRVIAQSIAFLYRPGPGLRTEDEPLLPPTPGLFGRIVRSIADLESTTLRNAGLEGVVLRYGGWYGPGTQFAPDGLMATFLRRGVLPVVRRANVHWNSVYVEDAAEAVVAALVCPVGAYNIVDNDPAPLDAFYDAFAQTLGTRPPRTMPAFATKVGGKYFRHVFAGQPAVSNAKAKAMGWRPRFSTWREGLRDGV